MASNAPPSREERGGLSAGTLVIASVASLTAAVVTSYFWSRGTPIAAAVTPVIVALVSEMLHRPATVISQRFTTETDALPEAAGAGPPPPRRETRGEAARDDEATQRDDPTRATEPLETGDPARPTEALEGGGQTRGDEQSAATAALRQATRERAATARARNVNGADGGSPPRTGGPRRGDDGPDGMRVYRGEPGRSLPWKAIAATAALAFVIAASVLTLPELVTGQSVGGGDRGTTFFGGSSRGGADDPSRESRERDRTAGEPAPQQEEEPAPEERPEPQPRSAPEGQAPPEEPTQTAPEKTVPETAPTQPPPAPQAAP
jgi:hypothetical protein